MDTHVHQIAIKHYGMKSVGKGKVAMSPALYEAISIKLGGVWGAYAGWAHSVNSSQPPRLPKLMLYQVLFTADLKSFASYGLTSLAPQIVELAQVQATGVNQGLSKSSQPMGRTKRKRGTDENGLIESESGDAPGRRRRRTTADT